MIKTTLVMVDADLVLLVGDRRTCSAWRKAWLKEPSVDRKEWLKTHRARKPKDAPRAEHYTDFDDIVPGTRTVVVVAIAPLQPGESRIVEDLRDCGFTVAVGVRRTSTLPPLPPPAPRTSVRAIAAEAKRCLAAYCEPDEREELWARVYAELIHLGGPGAAPMLPSRSSSDGSIGGGPPPGEARIYEDRASPLGKGEGDAAYWHDRYTAYDGHWDEHLEKCRVIREAGWHLSTLTGAPTHYLSGEEIVREEETEGQLTERVLRVGRGFGVAEVAWNMRIAESRVERIRRRAGVNVVDGEELVDVPAIQPNAEGRPPGPAAERAEVIAERRHQVRLLFDSGLSYRGIGLMLDISPATVVTDVKATRPLDRAHAR